MKDEMSKEEWLNQRCFELALEYFKLIEQKPEKDQTKAAALEIKQFIKTGE